MCVCVCVCVPVSQITLCSIFIKSNYFWIVGSFFLRLTVFLGIPITNPFWHFLYRITCHSTVYKCMTNAPWRRKTAFEITNTWDQLITRATLFQSEASLNSSSLYNSAHCSPTENLLPSLKSLLSRQYAFHSRLAVREKHFLWNASCQLMRCQLLNHTSSAFYHKWDY